MYFKRIAPILALLISSSLVVGCQSTNSQTTNNTTSVQIQVQEQIYTVKVESIQDKTITAIQGTLTQSQPPAMPEGQSNDNAAPPAMPEGQPNDNAAPPAMPEGQPNDNAAPPAMPEGQSIDNNGPPALSEGDSGAGGMTFTESDASLSFTVNDQTQITIEMLQGTQEGTLNDIGVNDILEVTLNEKGIATNIVVKNLSANNGFGGSHEVTQGTAAHTLDTDTTVKDTTYASTGDDENALRIDNATVTLDHITINKTEGDSSNKR